jgi:hypothetical protein
MPRAFGWFVYSFLFIYPDDQTSQRGRCGSYDRVQDHGPRVGVTTVVPTTLPYGPTKAYRDLTHFTMTPCKWHGRIQPVLCQFRFIEPCNLHLLVIYTNRLYPRRQISWETFPHFLCQLLTRLSISRSTAAMAGGNLVFTHPVKKTLKTSYGNCGDTIAGMRPG